MIYLDHHAASPLDPRARARMDAVAGDAWANPSSVHAAGRRSRSMLERAREEIAAAVGAEPSDVVITSGGTEACNASVAGFLAGVRRIVTTDVEHPAIAAAVDRFERGGGVVERLSVREGVPPSAETLAARITDDTLVAIQWINHETGTIFPIDAYAEICRVRDVPLVVDACQALGKVSLDVRRLSGVTGFALASSKIGGPLGAGALVVARGRSFEPQTLGGGQERGRRAGTPDVLAAAGFGAACARVGERLADVARVAALRDRIEQALVARGAVPHAAGSVRTATVSNVGFPGWQGAELVAALDVEGVCISAGAACSAGIPEPSAVIRAMHGPDAAKRAIRISLGPSTTEADVDGALAAFDRVLARGSHRGPRST